MWEKIREGGSPGVGGGVGASGGSFCSGVREPLKRLDGRTDSAAGERIF